MAFANPDDRREYQRDWRRRQRGSVALRGSYVMDGSAAERKAQKTKWIQAGKRTLIQMAKMVPCADCGVQYPPVAMDFDHVRGTKLFNLNKGWGRPWSAIHEEMAKCEVVCSNCHRVRTMLRAA
jgi:hypothetical protein